MMIVVKFIKKTIKYYGVVMSSTSNKIIIQRRNMIVVCVPLFY